MEGQRRKQAAQLIQSVLEKELCVRDALLQWPPMGLDSSVDAARHALIHYEADEELQVDFEYRQEQHKTLIDMQVQLATGFPLSDTVVQAYESFYGKSRNRRAAWFTSFTHFMQKLIRDLKTLYKKTP